MIRSTKVNSHDLIKFPMRLCFWADSTQKKMMKHSVNYFSKDGSPACSNWRRSKDKQSYDGDEKPKNI